MCCQNDFIIMTSHSLVPCVISKCVSEYRYISYTNLLSRQHVDIWRHSGDYQLYPSGRHALEKVMVMAKVKMDVRISRLALKRYVCFQLCQAVCLSVHPSVVSVHLPVSMLPLPQTFSFDNFWTSFYIFFSSGWIDGPELYIEWLWPWIFYVKC